MRWFALTLVCAVVTAVAATGATARTTIISVTTGPTAPLATALYDPIYQTSQRDQAFAMSSQAGSTYARIDISWKAVAPLTLPASGFDPTNPNNPYYHWSAMDATVSAAEAHGIQPILDIVGTPKWAYSTQPSGVNGGQPDYHMLGDFATALATRYDGSGPAPAVHAYSVYNEMNFNKNFYPQDPDYYRKMVNAVASSVHNVDPSNLALAGELAPYKHVAKGSDKNNVSPPLDWMRAMFCISKTNPTGPRTCPSSTKAHFDVWTHHPYSDKGPYGHASIAGGVELGDLPKMDALLQTAWNDGAIVTQNNQPPLFWITEIGWSSNPPNVHGVPIKLETRWVGEAYYQLWKSGATLGTWFLLQDLPKSTPLQSGLYTISPTLSTAVAKPLLAPFTMPFVAYLQKGGKVMVWGRDATSNKQDVEIDMRVGSKWKQVATVTSNDYGIFQATLAVHALAKYSMRASAGGVTSTTFSLTVPSNENMNVVPFPLN